MDRVWQELEHETGEFSAFMFLLMMVSQSGNESGSISTTVPILSRLSGLNPDLIKKTLGKLDGLGIVSCPEVSGSFRNVPEISRLQDKTIQDRREEGDLEKTADAEISGSKEPPPPPLETFWNTRSGNLPKIREVTAKRQRKWRALWREKPDEAYWASVIDRVSASAFCNGQNDRGWRADIDFFLQPDTHVKVLEGKYDGKQLAAPRVLGGL